MTNTLPFERHRWVKHTDIDQPNRFWMSHYQVISRVQLTIGFDPVDIITFNTHDPRKLTSGRVHFTKGTLSGLARGLKRSR